MARRRGRCVRRRPAPVRADRRRHRTHRTSCKARIVHDRACSPRPRRSSAPPTGSRSRPAASTSRAVAMRCSVCNSPERTYAHEPLPSRFFDPKRAADWDYRPDAAPLADRGRRRGAAQHAIKPSAADETRVHLLLIDVQKDFCFPEGTLYVAGRSGTGAIDDSRRIAEIDLSQPRSRSPTSRRRSIRTSRIRSSSRASGSISAINRSRPFRTITADEIAARRGPPEPGDGEVAVRRQLHVAVQAGRVLLQASSSAPASTSSTCGRRTACSAPTVTRSPA